MLNPKKQQWPKHTNKERSSVNGKGCEIARRRLNGHGCYKGAHNEGGVVFNKTFLGFMIHAQIHTYKHLHGNHNLHMNG